MILQKNEIAFLSKNQRIIEPILRRRIEEYKNLILQEEDEAKRDKLIKWTKEFQIGINTLYQIDKQEERDTGI